MGCLRIFTFSPYTCKLKDPTWNGNALLTIFFYLYSIAPSSTYLLPEDPLQFPFSIFFPFHTYFQTFDKCSKSLIYSTIWFNNSIHSLIPRCSTLPSFLSIFFLCFSSHQTVIEISESICLFSSMLSSYFHHPCVCGILGEISLVWPSKPQVGLLLTTSGQLCNLSPTCFTS